MASFRQVFLVVFEALKNLQTTQILLNNNHNNEVSNSNSQTPFSRQFHVLFHGEVLMTGV